MNFKITEMESYKLTTKTKIMKQAFIVLLCVLLNGVCTGQTNSQWKNPDTNVRISEAYARMVSHQLCFIVGDVEESLSS